VDKARIPGTQLTEFAGIGRGAEDYGAGRIQRGEDFRNFGFTQRADDDEVVRRRFVVIPEIAGEDGDCGSLTFG
jgi:hypothetical protein